MNEHPLVLVFYLDREMMMVPEIIGPFHQMVENTIAARNANAMAFFLPTDGEETVKCINPNVVPETTMEEVNQMIADIKAQFDIGQGADEGKDDPDNEVEIDPDNGQQ